MIRKPRKFSEENSALIGQIASTVTGITNLNSKMITIALNMEIGGTTTSQGGLMYLDAATEYVGVSFWADTETVDTSQNIVFTWIYECHVADATLTLKKYQGAQKTDATEPAAWDIANGTALSENVPADDYVQLVYTFSAADIDADDILKALFYLNEAARNISLWGCFCTYYLK